MNIWDIDLSFESGLLAIVSNVNKMKLMETYISDIPNEMLDTDTKRKLQESAISGDSKMMALYFHDLKEPQKGIITGLLKNLKAANNLEELTLAMKPILDNLKKNE